ncbi:MAG: pilus assembly protein [Proteobacteria bacterium]|nr:pilus assembly protein [Pseudomonadota bacterium]
MANSPRILARRKLAADRGGSVAVENAIVFGLLIVLTIALIEFSLALWQWNTAEKATELGVRYAVQSDPVALGLSEYNGVTGGGLAPGTSLTLNNLGAFTLSCTNTSCSCSGAGCGDFTSSVSNPTGVDTAAFNAIIARMDGVFRGSDLDASNVTIDYSHVGMGFAGRPGLDIVPVVTVRLTGVTFNFMVLSFIRPLMFYGSDQSTTSGIPMPPFTATLSGEDMYSGGTS